MGNIAQKAKAKALQRSKRREKNGSSRTKTTDPSILIAQASELLQIGQLEDALPVAERAVRLCSNPSNSQYALPALNLLAQIEIEMGDPEAAREHFKAAVELDPQGTQPEELGGGSEKFLWLAQLSEEGGRDSIHWFERGGAILEREITALQGMKDVEHELQERKAKLASTICGMIEVWMTDLSWEDESEAMCENLIAKALILSEPPLPSTLQTLASIKLSQLKIEDAQAALQRSMQQWEALPPEDPLVPDFPTRISLVRLLMEAKLEESALEVVETLIGEDDQSIEAWYLGGWCLWLLAHKENESPKVEDQKATLLSSREWLRNCLKLYDLLEYEDHKLRDHAIELVQGLDQQLGDEEIKDEDEEQDGEWEDEEESGDEDHEMTGA